MKFRTIFILFNIVLVVSFVFVFFLPFALLGTEYSLTFWKGNWFLALFFLALIGGLNAFFISNWKLFSSVEKEDWSGLSAWLVERIFTKKRYGNRHVSLLVNAYLLQSDVEGIERLEEELRARRPALLEKNALLFGVTRLLANRPAEAEAFLARYLDAKGTDNREWLRFDYGFSLVLQKRTSDALPFLKEGLNARDAVLRLLSAYLIGSLGAASTGDEGERKELLELSRKAREALRRLFPGKKWNAEVERAKNEIHVVILSKLVDDAGRWLFEPEAAGAAPSASTI